MLNHDRKTVVCPLLPYGFFICLTSTEKPWSVPYYSITQIGWNKDFIIAKRSSTFAGDPDGWVVLDVNKKIIKGIFSDEMIKKITEAKGICFLDSGKAWDELR